MTQLTFSIKALEELLATRKMILSDIQNLVDINGNEVNIKDFNQLFTLCDVTSLPEKDFISAHNKYTKKNGIGVTISRKDSLYSRIKGDNEHGGYHYRHVLTTPYDHDLLVLRTSPLSSKNQATPNKGHRVKEMVYVLNGKVGMVWLNNEGTRRYSEMSSGDSVFIESWVPHAFYTLEPNSQILAVDYY
ncbi:cupin domain-containing protein [Vibrio mediterranei]|uniref:cupin domain-containing protein n=1 Tax=Vibrio mediterranei TaxID=689 RepID=UPI0038CDF4E4